MFSWYKDESMLKGVDFVLYGYGSRSEEKHWDRLDYSRTWKPDFKPIDCFPSVKCTVHIVKLWTTLFSWDGFLQDGFTPAVLLPDGERYALPVVDTEWFGIPETFGECFDRQASSGGPSPYV